MFIILGGHDVLAEDVLVLFYCGTTHDFISQHLFFADIVLKQLAIECLLAVYWLGNAVKPVNQDHPEFSTQK